MAQNKGKPFFKTCLRIKFGNHKWVALIKLLKSLNPTVDYTIGYSDYDVFLENDEGSRVYSCKKLF
jgi:hypothetical protein